MLKGIQTVEQNKLTSMLLGQITQPSHSVHYPKFTLHISYAPFMPFVTCQPSDPAQLILSICFSF